MPSALADGMEDEPIEDSQRQRIQPQAERHTPVINESVAQLRGSQFVPYWDFGVYRGHITASNASVDASGATSSKFRTGWREYNSSTPYNKGIQSTRWYAVDKGWRLELTESKFAADQSSTTAAGINQIMIKRFSSLMLGHVWQLQDQRIITMTPYVGIGASLDYVNANVTTVLGGPTSSTRELSGVGVSAQFGLTKAITERASFFIETRYRYHDVSFDTQQSKVDFGLEMRGANIGFSVRF